MKPKAETKILPPSQKSFIIMSTKKTVPLSQIVDYATNEVNPSPNIKSFTTLATISKTIPDAKIAIRVQLTNKFKSYCNGFLPKKEMYYCLCLADFLVKQCPEFRTQVLNKDFMELFERASEISKMKKMSKKPSLVTEKAMKIVQSWGQLYPEELSDYQIMYDRYVSKGVLFPLLDYDDPEDIAAEELSMPKEIEDTIEEKIKKIASEINECTELIQETLEKVTNTSVQMHSIKALYKRAVEINSKFNVLFVTFMNQSNDTNLLQKYSQVENVFTSEIARLITFINKFVFLQFLLFVDFINSFSPQQALIYRTFSTGHIRDEEDENESDSLSISATRRKKRVVISPIDSTSASEQDRTPKTSSHSTRRGSNQLLPPPTSSGQPIKQPIQTIIQVHQVGTDNEESQQVVSHRIGKLKKRSFTQTELNKNFNKIDGTKQSLL